MPTVPTVWMNGAFLPEGDASVSLRDTGLLHAAGVFTTMRSYGGKVFRLSQHLARVRSSCQALSIPFPYKDPELAPAVGELLERNKLSDARLRLTITRGHASSDRPGELAPTLFLTAVELQPYPADYYLKGLTAAVEDVQRLNPFDIQAGHKTLNYFSRLAALRSANQRGAGEAFFFDFQNYLQSGSISNVFLVKDNRLVAPPTDEEMKDAALQKHMAYHKSAVLPGITRAVVLELARAASIETAFSAITIDDLLGADELFITNSIMGVMPVCRVERKAIGRDKPGPVTTRLMSDYAARIEEECQ